MQHLECLNEAKPQSVRGVFGSKGLLKSDVDEQLIISIPFQQSVKLHSIKIVGVADDGKQPLVHKSETSVVTHWIDTVGAPRTIKTYINRTTTLSFDEVDNVQNVESIALTEAQVHPKTAAVVPLRFVKYQSVHHLTVKRHYDSHVQIDSNHF
jgi:PITH domain